MNFHGIPTNEVNLGDNFTISQKGNQIEYSDKHRKRRFDIEIKDENINEEVADFICQIIECVLT